MALVWTLVRGAIIEPASSPRRLLSAAATGLPDRAAVNECGRAQFCRDPFSSSTPQSFYLTGSRRPTGDTTAAEL